MMSEAPGEAILGYRFVRPDLLREALTHRSAARPARGNHVKGAGSNERLEFIGDRVLGLVIAEWLAERYPSEQEGKLGPRLAQLVSQPVLARIAEEAGMSAVLSVAAGESRAGVRGRATVLADAMEAAIGAMYLDGGLAPARDFIRRAWASAIDGQQEPPRDAKMALQEWAQRRGLPLPVYDIEAREGPSHAPRFAIAVTIDGRTGRGAAGTKQAAEKEAARDLIGQLAACRPTT